jgi:hypothetical protein
MFGPMKSPAYHALPGHKAASPSSPSTELEAAYSSVIWLKLPRRFSTTFGDSV